MKKIKGISTVMWKCCDKKRIIVKHRKKAEVQENEKYDEIKEVNCFALVPVIKLPWYKKLFKSIRNYIVLYRWRKAR